MKTTRRGGLWAAAIIVILFGLVAAPRAQTDGQSSGDNPLQPVALTNAPEGAVFFKMSDYFANGGSLGGPYPFMPDTNAPMYSLNGSVFLVDDAVITNDDDLANALLLIAQPQDAFSSNLLNGNTMAGRAMAMDAPPDPTTDTNDSSGGGSSSNSYTPGVMTYPTNVLWIEVPTNSLATSNQFLVILHNTTEDAPYDVLTSTNLALSLSQWTVEQSTFGVEGTNCSPVALMMNGRSNLFVDARFGGSSDLSDLPDWWQQEYFGTNGVDPYEQDPSGDGYTFLQDFQNGFVPTNWHTPPPPQDFSAHLDSTGTNVVLTWQSGGGAVDHYEIDTGSDFSPVDLGDVDADTFTFANSPDFEFADNAFSAPHYRVRAVFTHGDHADTKWIEGPRLSSLDREIQFFRGPDAKFYLAVQNPTENLSRIHLYWFGDSQPPVDIYATNLVNGTIVLPPAAQGPDIPEFIQLVDSNGDYSQNIRPPLNVSEALDFSVTNFVDARIQMKENLKFLLRSATVSHPFSYASAVTTGRAPYQPYERETNSSDYVYYGFHTYSSDSGWAFMDETRPIQENFLWRNFVFDIAEMNSGILASGASGDGSPDDADRHLTDGPAYVYEGSGAETPLPLAFTNASAPWLFFASPSTNDPLALADLGLYLDGSGNLALAGDAFNVYGLQLNSAHFLSNGGYITINHGGAGAPIAGSLFLETAQPALSNVDYYFASQTAYLNYLYLDSPPALSPAFPGSPAFSTTDVSPLLVSGIGQPITVASWAKMAITNGNTNKFAYLEQYFDSANIIDSIGVVTTNSAGVLSPYGEFFPTTAGPAALVTLPDVDTGERGTGVVNVIKLQLDVNHDGTMDLSYGGPDNTSQAHPFKFWINNDNDGTGVGDDSYVGTNVAVWDCSSEMIRSQRDLEDFARLWICGMPSVPLFQNYVVTLNWRNTSGNPAIRLFSSCETNGSIGYLTNTNIAATQIGTNLLATYGRTIGTVSTNGTFTFPDGQFVFGGTAHLLFEGSGIGSGELVLTISRGTNVLAQTSEWLDLHDVTDFFEQAYATNITSGKPPSSLVSDFRVIHTANSPLPDETKQVTVFVHGINNTTEDYETTSRTIFKRLYWAGYHGRFSSFRWPCAYLPWTTLNPFEYNLGEFYAFKSAAALKNYLSYLRNNRNDLTGYAIDLYAHSQGNVVASEALLQGAPCDNYILTQGAFPAHCYDTNAPFLQKLLDAETNSVSAVDTPFYPVNGGYHGYCYPISGNLIDFYNTNDFALATGTTAGLQTNWEEDQRTQKPEAFITGPSYNFDTNTLVTTGYYPLGDSYTVTDLQEIKALVARSRSKAVGAQGGLHGVISGSVDLFSSYGFGNTRTEHSAQFARPIQTCLPYYQQMLTSFQIVTP